MGLKSQMMKNTPICGVFQLISSTENPYFHEKMTPISGVDSGVEGGVSRVDFIRLTQSESSRKCPTHFEHYFRVLLQLKCIVPLL